VGHDKDAVLCRFQRDFEHAAPLVGRQGIELPLAAGREQPMHAPLNQEANDGVESPLVQRFIVVEGRHHCRDDAFEPFHLLQAGPPPYRYGVTRIV